jgi:hypothetical protein
MLPKTAQMRSHPHQAISIGLEAISSTEIIPLVVIHLPTHAHAVLGQPVQLCRKSHQPQMKR